MTLLQVLSSYGGLLIFLCGITFHAIYIYFQSADHEKRIGSLETKNDVLTASIGDLRTAISNIDAKLSILLDNYSSNK